MKKRVKIIGIIAAVGMILMGGVNVMAYSGEVSSFIKSTDEWKSVRSKKAFERCMKGKSGYGIDSANCKGTGKYVKVCEKLYKNLGKYQTGSRRKKGFLDIFPECDTWYDSVGGGASGAYDSVGAAGGAGSSSSSSNSSTSGSSSSSSSSSSSASGGSNSGCVETSLFGCVDVGSEGEGIFMLLNIILNVMTYGVGILATAGIVWAGYTYLTAKDDASKIMKAKERILQVVIGLVIYAVMWSVLQFILPGGLFGNGG